MTKVVFTEPLLASLVEQWRNVLTPGDELEAVAGLDETEFARCAEKAEVLVNLWRRLDAALLLRAPRVRFIQQMSVGYDHLDLAAIRQAGILLAHTPGANTQAVAEHTILLMLSLLKRFLQAEQAARANTWNGLALSRTGIGDLATATVGLVGFGTIGQAVAQRLRPFGPRVLYTARHQMDQATEERLGAVYAPFREVLASATILSLHVPLTDQTRHLIGEPELAQMPPGALLINTSRGALIDEQSVRQALMRGALGGAALDVIEREANGGNPFTDLPQVIVTPHIAGLSRAAIERVLHMGLTNVARFLRGEPPHYLVPGQEA